jgi:hypothetical protein
MHLTWFQQTHENQTEAFRDKKLVDTKQVNEMSYLPSPEPGIVDNGQSFGQVGGHGPLPLPAFSNYPTNNNNNTSPSTVNGNTLFASLSSSHTLISDDTMGSLTTSQSLSSTSSNNTANNTFPHGTSTTGAANDSKRGSISDITWIAPLPPLATSDYAMSPPVSSRAINQSPSRSSNNVSCHRLLAHPFRAALHLLPLAILCIALPNTPINHYLLSLIVVFVCLHA